MKTVFEEAIETGEKTFPTAWRFIQERVAAGDEHQAITDALRAALSPKLLSKKFWQWVEDAITAAEHRSEFEAHKRRRRFRIVKGDEQ